MAKRKKNTQTVQVPLAGNVAYSLGFSAADCPHPEGTEEFERWNREWDAEADFATAKEAAPNLTELASMEDQIETQEEKEILDEEEERGGDDTEEDGEEPAEDGDEEPAEEAEKSVVKSEYRARYAEAGHPSHCGDELAVLLNNLCLAKAGFDLPRFEAICEANGVSLAKYNRTTNGWQGRLRMTGRNLLSAKVYAAGGVIHTPIEGAEQEYKLSAEWMATRAPKTKKAA